MLLSRHANFPSDALSCLTLVRFATNADAEHLRLYGQANKRMWWMPRRQEAMKDVVACEMPRGAGNKL